VSIAQGTLREAVLANWGITHQTAYNWLKAFVEQGWDSLSYRRPPGRPARLTKNQKQKLYETVKAGPEAVGYETGCWTTCLIQDWIYKQFGVLYNRFYISELLHNLGFSYQKAHFVSDHLDETARRHWMQTIWPRILAWARQQHVPIFFGDEVSFAQWGSLARTWAPVGEQPVVKTSGKRKGYKIFGVIEFFHGQFFYQGIDGRFTSESYQTFLEYLMQQVPGKMILIQDGAKYHTSQAMFEFFEEHQNRLMVYQLPSYSPDYNPIEYLWKKAKGKATHNRYFDEFAKLINSVENALATLASETEEIIRLMGVYTKHAFV
jgi:transposase